MATSEAFEYGRALALDADLLSDEACLAVAALFGDVDAVAVEPRRRATSDTPEAPSL